MRQTLYLLQLSSWFQDRWTLLVLFKAISPSLSTQHSFPVFRLIRPYQISRLQVTTSAILAMIPKRIKLFLDLCILYMIFTSGKLFKIILVVTGHHSNLTSSSPFKTRKIEWKKWKQLSNNCAKKRFCSQILTPSRLRIDRPVTSSECIKPTPLSNYPILTSATWS